jgi:serine/threonine protein phosphatase PrpC
MALRHATSRLAALAAASALYDRCGVVVSASSSPSSPSSSPASRGGSDGDYEYDVRVLGESIEDEVYARYFGPGLLSRATERLLHFSYPPSPEEQAEQAELAGAPSGLSMCSYPANFPTEDRACTCHAALVADFQELSSSAAADDIDVFAVFDGHGGYQVSDYASTHLVPYLLNSIRDSDPSNPEVARKYVNAETGDGVRVAAALKESFGRVERDIVSKLQPAFDMGFGNVARVGCCALVVVLRGNGLWVANAGDCAAVLGRRGGGGGGGGSSRGGEHASSGSALEAVALSSEHNIRHLSEKQRLLKLCPGELERGLVRCKSETSCYVKGHLQPSRGLGDAYLKYSEFRGPAPSALRPYVRSDPARSRRVRAPFAPPYILTEPEIEIVTIGESDDWLILASDGLWDEMSPQEAVNLCEEFARRKKALARWRDHSSGSGGVDSRVLSTSPDHNSTHSSSGEVVTSAGSGGGGGGGGSSSSSDTSAATSQPGQLARRRSSRDPGHMPTVATTAAEFLVHTALQRAADTAGKTLAQVKDLPQGKRRNIHDDITVVVVDLGARRRHQK